MTAESTNDVLNFIRSLVKAIAGCSLYSAEHARFIGIAEEAHARLRQVFSRMDDLVLLVIEDELVCNRVPLDTDRHVDTLVRMLSSKGVEHLQITREVGFPELLRFIGCLTRSGEQPTASENIRLSRVGLRRRPAGENPGPADETADSLALGEIPEYMQGLFQKMRDSVQGGEQVCMAEVAVVVRSFVRAFRQVSSPLGALAALRALDEHSFSHSTNVCILNLAQVMAMGIEGNLLQDMGVAGLLHDVGKLFLPEQLFTKQGNLDPAERELVRQHPVLGANYLFALQGVPKLAAITAYEHHWRFDGTGYPRAMQGRSQHPCSQITAISDYYDVLRTNHGSREAAEADAVSATMLANAGTRFNPALVRHFLAVIARMPNGEPGFLLQTPDSASPAGSGCRD